LFILPMSANALDIRDKVRVETRSEIVKLIDPDKAIFGIPFGTTEDDFIKAYGKPNGYIQLSATDSGMLYGSGYFFFFENKKLSGVRVTHSVLDWKISNEIKMRSPFDNLKWKLDNGIQRDMNRAEIKRILGDRLKTERGGYQHYYETQKSRVDLDFSYMADADQKDDASHNLFGITVQLK
ncbi:MAG TPA: hypothetical protein VJU83_03425, partial [Burkholderiales bacterium]|nr:hypothetical protein [Burkholderiales bacterium]